MMLKCLSSAVFLTVFAVTLSDTIDSVRSNDGKIRLNGNHFYVKRNAERDVCEGWTPVAGWKNKWPCPKFAFTFDTEEDEELVCLCGSEVVSDGKDGQALKSDGHSFATADIESSECASYPPSCPEGGTYTFWIKIIQCQRTSFLLEMATRTCFLDCQPDPDRLRFFGKDVFSEKWVDSMIEVDSSNNKNYPGLDTWFHVALVFEKDPMVFRVWLNGKSMGEAELLERPETPEKVSYRLSFFSDILMDELLLWDEPLTKRQIRRLVRAGVGDTEVQMEEDADDDADDDSDDSDESK